MIRHHDENMLHAFRDKHVVFAQEKKEKKHRDDGGAPDRPDHVGGPVVVGGVP